MRILFITLVSISIIFLLIVTRPDSKAELQDLAPAVVEVTSVKIMDVQPLTTITGRLQPARKARLQFEVSGRVTNRNIEPGQRVTTGDLLLKIYDGDFSDSYMEAQSMVAQETEAIKRDKLLLDLTREQVQLQENELERLAKLEKESLSSKSRFDEAKRSLLRYREQEARLRQSVSTASSRLQLHNATLNRAKRNLDRTRLAAPFDATINSVAVEVGDYVTPGQPAVDLVMLNELDLYIEVTGPIVISLYLGQEIQVNIQEQTRTGRIVAITVDPDPRTNTHAVRVRLPGDGLIPGMLASAELPGRLLADALVIPLTAILYEDGFNFVYQVENNHLVKTRVNSETRVGDYQVITGINRDARIVARDVSVLVDQQKVKPGYLVDTN